MELTFLNLKFEIQTTIVHRKNANKCKGIKILYMHAFKRIIHRTETRFRRNFILHNNKIVNVYRWIYNGDTTVVA